MAVNLTGRLATEHQTMAKMMRIYCRDHCDGPKEAGLCGECQALLDYAAKKLDRCPYGEDKPTCGKCPIHCYKPEPREQARQVMRYAGPRMLWHHPVDALRHLLDSRRKVPAKPPMRSNRAKAKRPGPSPAK